MRYYFHHRLLYVLLLAAVGCHRAPVRPGPSEVAQPSYGFAKEAIAINIESDRQLNMYQGRPHTLAICVYQLRDPNAFNQLTDSKEGISKLMECSPFDASVVNDKMLFVQPGQKLTSVLDRAEGARYVGIVAGYFVQEKDKVIRLLQIPVSGQEVETLTIDLHLGPQRIKEIES